MRKVFPVVHLFVLGYSTFTAGSIKIGGDNILLPVHNRTSSENQFILPVG